MLRRGTCEAEACKQVAQNAGPARSTARCCVSQQQVDTRYTTLVLNDTAQVDDGAMWPASFAVMSIGPAE